MVARTGTHTGLVKEAETLANRNQTKPNILVILSDDQGSWAMGCAGNPEIRTPNLDALAASGMRFENFFCTSPVCSPARASLLTGRIPSQHGIHDWIKEGNVGERALEYLAGQPAYTDFLASQGYSCGISGKWHLGDSLRPQKSFTHWFVHQKGSGPYYNAPMIRNGRLTEEPGYVTDAITDDALAHLEECARGDHPFYLSVHYTAPHTPWIGQHPEEIVKSYDDCPLSSCPQESAHPWSGEFTKANMANRRENLKGYFAAVTAMDLNIGRLLRKLTDLGLREHTLVCYMSDNGYNCGHHGIWGKGNGTFPLNMYDTSIRVPAIFSQPGVIPAGAVCASLVSGYDFLPTLLDYVGLEHGGCHALPGRSFLGLLRGQGTKGWESIVVFDEYGPVRAIRGKEYKYVHHYPYGPHEIYDLVNDPEERINLIDDQGRRAIVAAMKAMLEEWFFRYVDPGFDGTHEPVRGAGQYQLAGPAGRGLPAFP